MPQCHFAVARFVVSSRFVWWRRVTRSLVVSRRVQLTNSANICRVRHLTRQLHVAGYQLYSSSILSSSSCLLVADRMTSWPHCTMLPLSSYRYTPRSRSAQLSFLRSISFPRTWHKTWTHFPSASCSCRATTTYRRADNKNPSSLQCITLRTLYEQAIGRLLHLLYSVAVTLT